MSLRPDHKALVFVGAIAVLGASVRVIRAASGETVSAQPALDHQLAVSDSARVKQASGRQGKGRGRQRGQRGARTDSTRASGPQGIREQAMQPNRRGYVNGKLDLDVATAAQIDSLPGIVPGVAKRIVADRMALGPFYNSDGLRRVGLAPRVLRQLDPLVTYSGSFSHPSTTDTVIVPRARKSRGHQPTRPAMPT
jgi:DNA uptake protein ComE-like DNA-binding protein